MVKEPAQKRCVMTKYDPHLEPVDTEWLGIPEADRIDMVADYHRRHRVPLPNRQVHATIHVVVENQIALGEQVVISALQRLQGEGLDRHDAIHAIGMVLSEHFYNVLRADGEPKPDAHAPYSERLKRLTAYD